MIEHFRFLQSQTGRVAKMTIPSPSALYGRTGREAVSEKAYRSLDDFFADWGAAYRKAVRAFADAGCRYLQLDEVFIPMLCDEKYRQAQKDRGDDPDRLAVLYGDLINTAMSDIPDDMTVTMHMCRGNFAGAWVAEGGYEPVAELLFNAIDVDGYFLEYDSERAGGFEPLRFLPKGKIAVLGLVTTKSAELESKDALKRRIDEAARYAPLEQLALSPQCGFESGVGGSTMTMAQQAAKLRLITETARDVWGNA